MLNQIIDTSVIYHLLVGVLQRNPDIVRDSQVLNSWVKSHLIYLDSGGWLLDADCQTLWVMDVKDANGRYWRTHWLNENGYDDIEYKAGRRSKDPLFLRLAAIANGFLSKHCACHGEVGLEADDIAAKVSNHLSSQGERVVLLTVDTDWIGLVNDHVAWVNTHDYWKPRVRQDIESINEWSTHSKMLRNNSLDYPRQIWELKSRLGDSSDNLPPGSPLEVIDLIQSPVKPRQLILPRETKFSEKVQKQASHMLRISGTPSPVKPLDTACLFTNSRNYNYNPL